MEQIYVETKWNRCMWERNGTDLCGNEMEPFYVGTK